MHKVRSHYGGFPLINGSPGVFVSRQVKISRGAHKHELLDTQRTPKYRSGE